MPYQGSAQQYTALVQQNVMLTMRDGVKLATNLYFPSIDGQIAEGPFPVILERTPYDKDRPDLAVNGHYFARRGYVCAVQDVRGRFASEGEWYAFAKEAPDGYDTVQWLGEQPWSDGQVGTMGASYAGSDQSALATLNPSHLKSMVVAVGASNYYNASMRQNGALEFRFQIYAFLMATTAKECLANPALKAVMDDAFARIEEWVGRAPLKKGASPLRHLPSYEQWALDILQHGDYDDYWKQRGYAINEYYHEHADVATLYLGGWYDSYARATCENYIALSKLKTTPQRLLMGPWTHGGWPNSFAGDVDFGLLSMLDSYNDLRCAWFDWTLKGMLTSFSHADPVRIFVMGGGSGSRNYKSRLDHGGQWRDEKDWPAPAAKNTPYYLHGDGSLSSQPPAEPGAEPVRFTYNPRDPVPTLGGGISAAEPVMRNGAFDQRARLDFYGCKDTLPLSARSDVLVFQSAPLSESVEVTGPITMKLWASSSAKDTDFTAKLIDVYPPNADYADGFAMNLTDSIIRARYRNSYTKPALLTPNEVAEFTFELYPTSNLFTAGHCIRVDISSSNFPRFDVNPNTGGPLGSDRRMEVAHQAIYLDAAHPSHIILPVVEHRAMPSPFPGMDPYLEGSEWTSVHAELSSEIARQLSPQLRPKYVARTVRRFVADADLYPDVGIQSSAGPGTVRESAPVWSVPPLQLATVIASREPQLTIEIRDVARRELVAAIEVLSPSNKRGEGFQEYVDKRSRILRSNAHLLEIDLLRKGSRVPMAAPLPQASYFVILSRAERRPIVEVWPVQMQDRLPIVPVPLLAGDPDVSLDLQAALNAVYDALSYDLSIDYTRPPDVPLSSAESESAATMMAGARGR